MFFNTIHKFWLIVRASTEGFIRDDCYLKASALTFYTLLSIVPLLAVGMGVAKGFGFESNLESILQSNFAEYTQLVALLIAFANSMLEQSKGGLIAGIGVIALFWTVISLLTNIETAFNDVWKVKIPRTYLRKFSDYLTAMIVCPVFVLISSSLTVYLTHQVTNVTTSFQWLETFSPFLFFLLKLIPYILSWLLFTYINKMMPNTHVEMRTAVFAGIIAGTAYQLLQSAYIHFQFMLSNYGAVYGSFAALPLFLIWLQLSWIVVLASAEIAYYSENNRARWHLQGIKRLSFAGKKQLSQILVDRITEEFENGNSPQTTAELSLKTEIPFDLAQQLLSALVRGKILSEVKTYGRGSKETAYLPARDAKYLTIERIDEALENDGLSVKQLGILDG